MLQLCFIFKQIIFILLYFFQLMLKHAILLEVVIIINFQIFIFCLSILYLANQSIDLCNQLFIISFSISSFSFQQFFVIIRRISKLLSYLL